MTAHVDQQLFSSENFTQNTATINVAIVTIDRWVDERPVYTLKEKERLG